MGPWQGNFLEVVPPAWTASCCSLTAHPFVHSRKQPLVLELPVTIFHHHPPPRTRSLKVDPRPPPPQQSWPKRPCCRRRHMNTQRFISFHAMYGNKALPCGGQPTWWRRYVGCTVVLVPFPAVEIELCCLLPPHPAQDITPKQLMEKARTYIEANFSPEIETFRATIAARCLWVSQRWSNIYSPPSERLIEEAKTAFVPLHLLPTAGASFRKDTCRDPAKLRLTDEMVRGIHWNLHWQLCSNMAIGVSWVSLVGSLFVGFRLEGPTCKCWRRCQARHGFASFNATSLRNTLNTLTIPLSALHVNWRG